jgi:hypothetical protein
VSGTNFKRFTGTGQILFIAIGNSIFQRLLYWSYF